MRLTRILAIALSIGLLTHALKPRPAHALDLASSTAATIGGVVAIVGAILMGQEENKQTGRTMLTAGLAVSAVSSTSALVLNLIVLASQDRVMQLEQEADAGGGPLIDALSSGFGVSQQDVIQSIHRARTAVAPGEARLFSERLVSDLASRASVSAGASTRILHDLHLERAHLGARPAPRHELLAEIVGVPVEKLAPMIAVHLDEALQAGERPGEIISARTIFSANSEAILNGLVDAIATKHEDDLNARAAAARAESHTYRALNDLR